MEEIVTPNKQHVQAREVARFEKDQCRLLETADGRVFVEYLASTGPYKIDVPTLLELSSEQFVAYTNGTLDIASLLPTT